MTVDTENLKTMHTQEPHLAMPPFSQTSYYNWRESSAEENINLLEYWQIIRKYKSKIVLFVLGVTLATYIYSLRMPKQYQAEVVISPVVSSSGGGVTTLMNQLSSIPIVGGQLGSLGGGKQQVEQFINILKSRTLTEGVIQDFNLMPILFKEQWDAAKNNWKLSESDKIPRLADGAGLILGSVLKILEDKKTGLIKIQVLFEDPQLATNIANHYIVRLQDFVTNNSLTVAKRNRLFIETQLQKNKIKLLEFSKKLSQFYTTNQVSSVQSKLNVDVGTLESLPKTFEEFREKLTGLEQKKQESDSQFVEAEKSGIVKDIPAQVYLQYLNLQRDLLGQTNALLMQQYELAKIDEAKEDLAFQVIDKAIVPLNPSFPKIRLNIAIAFVGGLFFSIFFVFFYEFIKNNKGKDEIKTLK